LCDVALQIPVGGNLGQHHGQIGRRVKVDCAAPAWSLTPISPGCTTTPASSKTTITLARAVLAVSAAPNTRICAPWSAATSSSDARQNESGYSRGFAASTRPGIMIGIRR
jgi:hypothetical protein